MNGSMQMESIWFVLLFLIVKYSKFVGRFAAKWTAQIQSYSFIGMRWCV